MSYPITDKKETDGRMISLKDELTDAGDGNTSWPNGQRDKNRAYL